MIYKIFHNARILFVGINPHPGSDRRGVPFSNNKTLWHLNQAGLIHEPLEKLKRGCASEYGWQENIGKSKVYLMHFPIRGLASIRIRELQELKGKSSN